MDVTLKETLDTNNERLLALLKKIEKMQKEMEAEKAKK